MPTRAPPHPPPSLFDHKPHPPLFPGLCPTYAKYSDEALQDIIDHLREQCQEYREKKDELYARALELLETQGISPTRSQRPYIPPWAPAYAEKLQLGKAYVSATKSMTGKLSIILDLKKEQKARRRLDKQREKDLEDSEWEERLKSLETFAKGTKSGIMRGRNEKVVLRKEDGGKDDAGRVMNEEERRFLEKANKMSPLLKVKSVKITRHGRDVEEVEEDEQGEGDGGEEVNRWMSLTEDLD